MTVFYIKKLKIFYVILKVDQIKETVLFTRKVIIYNLLLIEIVISSKMDEKNLI